MASVATAKAFTAASQGFAGGINLKDAPDQLQPNELLKAENVVFDAAGGLTKRLGSRNMGPFGSSGELVLSAYTFYRPGSNPQVLIHTSAGNMYYTNDATAQPITWGTVKTGLSTTVPAAFETQNSMCYFAEGTQLGQWDGAGYTAVAGAPAGVSMLRVWKDTMWAAAPATNPDRLYSSSAGLPTSWPAANYVDILHGDGDILSALSSDGLFLIASKRRRIQVVFDPAVFSNRTADWEKGSESHFGWVHIEDKLLYLSRHGVVEWMGDSSGRLISYKIDNLFNISVLNLNALQYVQAYTSGNRCGWALPESGSNVPTILLEYYPRLGPIYQISGNIGPGPWLMHRLSARGFTLLRQGATENLMAGSTVSNKFMWLFSPDGTDDGTTVTSVVTIAPTNFNNPMLTKYIRRARVVGRGKFNFQMIKDYQTAVWSSDTVVLPSRQSLWNNGVWGTGNWGPNANIQDALVDLDIYGKAFSIQISDSETNTGTQLMSLGSHDYQITRGQWAIYEVTFDGQILGLRS